MYAFLLPHRSSGANRPAARSRRTRYRSVMAVLAAGAVLQALAAGSAAAQPDPVANGGGAVRGRALHVDARSGSDDNPGSFKRPFRTIDRAADAVQPGDTVFIRGGVYREAVTLDRSGTESAPITFRPWGKENVTISGARPVEGWEATEVDGVYAAEVDVPVELSPETSQVFLNGEMAVEAREPDLADARDPFSQHWLPMVKGVAAGLQTTAGQWVRVLDGGGGEVRADGPSAGLWEQLYLVDTTGGALVSGDTVGFLTADHRHYLTAENGGTPGATDDVLVADRTEFDSWQTFTIEEVGGDGVITTGDPVSLRAAGQGYLSADRTGGSCGGGGLRANAVAVGECEQFVLTVAPEQLVLFDEEMIDLDGSDDALAGSYVWGRFGAKWSLGMAEVVGSAPGKLVLGATDEWWNAFGWTHGEGAVIGARGALDADDEWYLETTPTGATLFVRPAAGRDPNHLNIEIRDRMWVIDANASHVVFDTVNVVAGQVRIHGDGNVITNSTMRYGTHFVFSEKIGESADVELGRNGVFVLGDRNVVRNSEIAHSAGSGMVMRGDGNIVENSLIHDIGYRGTYTSGVLFQGTGSKLLRSTIFRSGRDLLHISECRTCEFSFNLLHDSTLLTDDSGAIYAFGRDLAGTTIDHNWIWGRTSTEWNVPGIQLGIYLDNGTRNALVHHNVISGLGDKAGIGTNTPHQGLVLCNNTLIHNASSGEFARIGEGAFCSCNFDANPGLPDPFAFEALGACVHERDADGKVVASACVNDSCEYWMDPSRLTVRNTAYYATFAEAAVDLVNPQEVIVAPNGWQLVGRPDFRPRRRSVLVDAGSPCPGVEAGFVGAAPDVGAYERGGPNWIPGYRPTRTSPRPGERPRW